MTTFTFQETERHDLPRRMADKAINDRYKALSTPQCHACLELTDNAVLLLDSEGRIMHVTSQAEHLIHRSNLSFTLRSKFTLLLSPNAGRFSDFMNGKNNEPGPLILLLTGERNQDMLLLTCFRLPEPTVSDLNVARYLVSLRDRNNYLDRQWQFFTEQFGLTRAEARLCLDLADGLTLNDYCANWGVTIGTARGQLKGIFAKTSTNRQSDLLRLIYLFTRS